MLKEDVWYNIHRPVKSDFLPAVRPGRAPKTPAFAAGDFVRINKTRRLFKKGYLGGWSKEVFTVAAVRKTTPKTYELNDTAGESVKGAFYPQELQRVAPPEFYDIEKVVSTRKKGGKSQYFVKWVGYPPSFNSWVSDVTVKKFN